MPNVLDLRRRIRSVKNTRQITKAMKMVSAAKLRRAQEHAMAARPYERMLSNVLDSLMRRIDLFDPRTGEVRSPLLLEREERRVLFIVISGEKGFAGAFNANILKAAVRFINEKSRGANRNGAAGDGQIQIDLEPIGRKGRDLLRKRYPVADRPPVRERTDIGIYQGNFEDDTLPEERTRKGQVEVVGDHPGLFDKLTFEKVIPLAREVCARYAHQEIDAAYIVFNEFQSVIAQRVVLERILPITEIGKHDIRGAEEMTEEQRLAVIRAAQSAGVSVREPDTEEEDEENKKFGTGDVDYIYEQPPHELLNDLLPRYVTMQIYHAMLESIASEHAARMTAMDAASNNAGEMIDSLTLTMNRVRQAAITREIIEIVSGAAAL